VEAGRLPLTSIEQAGVRVIGIAGPLVPCAVTEAHEPLLGVKPEPLTVTVNPTTADPGDREISAAACTGGKRSAGVYGVW
jgi:hypothetical protein